MRKYDNKKNKSQYKKLYSEGREKAIRVKSRTIPLTTLAGQHKNVTKSGTRIGKTSRLLRLPVRVVTHVTRGRISPSS